jgi:hypothetical protein
MKKTALFALMMSVTVIVPAQNTPAPAAAAPSKSPTAAAAPTTTKAAEPQKQTSPNAAAPANTKSANASTGDAAKDSVKEPAAAQAKAADASKKEVTEIKKPLTTPPCPIAEFRAIGMETHDVVARRAKALDWLAKKGKQCSPEKLVAIRNNRPQWMGHADSTVVAAAVDSLLEASIEGNPKVLNLLYGTQPPPPKPPEEKKPPK